MKRWTFVIDASPPKKPPRIYSYEQGKCIFNCCELTCFRLLLSLFHKVDEFNLCFVFLV